MPPLALDPASVDEAAVALRRRLHENPEASFAETETARVVAERMRRRGLPVRTGLGGTGVAALLDTGRSGPTLLLRADMDALPVVEATGLPFASTNGRMHACGHDGHVAALDAAADLLLLDPPERGRVVLAFQPGEEAGGGAEAMIADGVLEDPRPDRVFGLHLWTPLPLGTVGVAAGPVMAAVDEIRIEVAGRGGHAAMPHEARDPVVAAAHVVLALQSVVSRRLSPLSPAVLSVTTVHGGTAFNVVPGSVVLTGTCRSFDREVFEALPGLVEETAARAAEAAGCRASTSFVRHNRAVVNDPTFAATCAGAAGGIVGPSNVTPDCRTMGGEDFSELLERVPGVFAFVGAALPEGPERSHHAPDFDFDERAIGIASRVHAAVARAALRA
ncbi:MAG: amidohydrolase [Acidobacteria bacterium]|nr:MAG: amidohydrolase [Acidobacteriota bacterium]